MNQVGPFGCDYNRGFICTYSIRWILTSGGRTRRACGQHLNGVVAPSTRWDTWSKTGQVTRETASDPWANTPTTDEPPF